jgi:hypothetical protein
LFRRFACAFGLFILRDRNRREVGRNETTIAPSEARELEARFGDPEGMYRRLLEQHWDEFMIPSQSYLVITIPSQSDFEITIAPQPETTLLAL